MPSAQFLEHVGGPVVDGRHQFVERQIGPGGGLGLFAGRGPGVAVMTGEQKAQAGGFNALGIFFRVFQITERFVAASGVSTGSVRIDEDAGADEVELIGFENLKNVFLDAAVEICRALSFVLQQPGDIGAQDVRPLAGR
jgi:hypothetical protein